MKNNKKIKKAFSSISISPEVEKKILNQTINRKKKPYLKFAYVVLILFVIGICSLPIVYAEYFKQIINQWSSSVQLEDDTKIPVSENNGFKMIPNDAIKTEKYKSGIEMTYSEVEKMLGFKILKLELKEKPSVYYTTSLNQDGSIGRVDLWISSFVGESEEKYICLSVSMLNIGADSGYISAFHGDSDAVGGKIDGETYHLKNLDVDVVMYGNDWDSSRLNAVFVYKDIQYAFIGKNYSRDEMFKVLEQLGE